MIKYKYSYRIILNPLKWTFGSFRWLDGSYTIGIGPFGEIDMILENKR